ncbi:MAG: SOS response-associated peptidase [Flavobacteriales bacterium]|nr:SOS response-associated peptidase [Flavobacteriales bacterium]
MLFCYNILQYVRRFKKAGKHAGLSPEEVQAALEDMLKRTGFAGFDPESETFRSANAADSDNASKGNGVSNGFDHNAHVALYREDGAIRHDSMLWGLIPGHITNAEAAKEIAGKTLNARAETIFEKPSFKYSVLNKRCLLPLNGFFEHHHKGGKTIPHYITKKDAEFYFLASIYDEWHDPHTGNLIKTFSIVTTEANEMMAKIHNAKKNDPRMPLVLSGDDLLVWLDPDSTKEQLTELMQAAPNDWLEAHTVKPLKGKNSATDVDDAIKPFHYPDEVAQQSLF